jgi:nucleoside-diphosphate-sugar epimerase
MEKVLVTGASGFVGTHLVAGLVARGFEVVATSRCKPAYLASPAFGAVRFYAADLHDETALREALQGVTTVYHTAARFDFFADYESLAHVNVDGTERLCRLARAAGVKRFVNFGSGAIYGTGYGNKLVSEKDEPKPTDRYAKSKWEAEKKVFAHHGKDGMLAVSLRLGAIYGPGSSYGDATALYLLKKGLLFVKPGFGHAVSSHIHVKDAVEAAIHLAITEAAFRADAKEVADIAINVADNEPAPNAELLKAADKMLPATWRVPGLGLPLPRMRYLGVPVPAALLKGFAWLAETVARLTKTKPLFEVESIDYITCGHALDNSRLRGLGYTLLYPSILGSLGEIIGWYEKTGWRVFKDGDTSQAIEGFSKA